MMTEIERLVGGRLQELLSQRGRVVVGIDGDCASGKTTMARFLAERYGGRIIHMDDFFLRPEQRTPQRYEEPGGNIDYERFCQEAAKPLLEGRVIVYRRFDCVRMEAVEKREFLPGRLTIVEGAYSLHPKIGYPYDLKIFLKINEGEQRDRIIKRNGKEAYLRFQQQWIPYEKKYFRAFQVMENSDLVLEAHQLREIVLATSYR